MAQTIDRGGSEVHVSVRSVDRKFALLVKFVASTVFEAFLVSAAVLLNLRLEYLQCHSDDSWHTAVE